MSWTGIANATATGNSLRQAGGAYGSGVSVQHLASGDGYVEVTVTDPTMDYVVSLGSATTAGSVGGHALHFSMNRAEVREGSWKLEANTFAATGDVFRIAVVNGQVQYMRNGTSFYTSPISPASQYPLVVLASLWSFGATVSNANLSPTFALAPAPRTTAHTSPLTPAPAALLHPAPPVAASLAWRIQHRLAGVPRAAARQRDAVRGRLAVGRVAYARGAGTRAGRHALDQ